MADDANKTHQVHLTFDVVGPACQNVAGNHHIRGQKKIAFSYSDPGDTLEKIKHPETLIQPQVEPYVSKEVKENALALEGKSCRPADKQ